MAVQGPDLLLDVARTASPPRSRPVGITVFATSVSVAASMSPIAVLVPPTSTPIAASPVESMPPPAARSI